VADPGDDCGSGRAAMACASVLPVGQRLRRRVGARRVPALSLGRIRLAARPGSLFL
jgi:hypothetical protein